MRVVWTEDAQHDRLEIWDTIATESVQAAVKIDELFSNATGRLAEHPLHGRPGLIAGTRELIPHKSYRLVYEILDDAVWILTIVHTARKWPPVR